MSASPSNDSYPSPVFAPAFAHDEDVDEQLDFGLTLESPPAYVFSNDLAFETDAQNDESAFADPHDGKAASMRSISTQRDSSAFGFEPLITPRSFEGIVETNIYEANGKTPVFVLDQALPSPLNADGAKSFDFYSPTVLKSAKAVTVPSSPLSPASFIEIPEKEETAFFAVNPAFTSYEAPEKIMDVVKSALSTLRCEVKSAKNSQWTLYVSCLLVAEEISFSINLFQLRGVSNKYEVEFVRRSGDELVFTDLAEHIRSKCSEVDDEAALSLFSKNLDAWLDDKQELVGRRFAINESEASSLLEELNCEYLHMDSLYQVARSVKNHCRHKGNRKLFVQKSELHKNLLKGLRWMLSDSDELARYALFVLLQYAGDDELYSTFFSTPIDKSNVSLNLDSLYARADKDVGLCSKFTTDMVDAVRQSVLFA